MRDNQSTLSLGPTVSKVLGVWRYGFLLESLIVREIRVRYRRSALGVIWTLLNPILTMLVFTLIFSLLFSRSIPDFPIYILSAMLAWSFFSQTSSQCMTSMLRSAVLYKRIFVPKHVFILASVGAGLINFLLSLIPLAGLIIVMRHPITPALLFVPVGLITLVAFTTGISFIVATIAVFFDDLTQFYSVILQLTMYMCAIFYPITIVPKTFRLFIELNPMYYNIQMLRLPIYEGQVPPLLTIFASVSSAVIALMIGWFIFNRTSDRFVYYV